MKTQIKYIRSNGVNDIFSFIDENGLEDFIKFPRSMEMTESEVEEYLN